MSGLPAEVRAARANDSTDIARIYRPYVLHGAASFEQEPPDENETLRRMLAVPRLPWLVGVRDGEVAGYAHASRHRARPAYRWSVEVSVYLASTEAGRGTGRALYDRLLREVRDLGYVSAFAGITLPNDRSVRLHEAAGFVPVGVFRSVGFKHSRWHDVSWWQRPLTSLPATPREPVPWVEPGEVAPGGA